MSNNEYEHGSSNKNKILSKNYYGIDEVCPKLRMIFDDLDAIEKEVAQIKKDIWPEWPEKELYDGREAKPSMFKSNNTDYKWNIYPFFAFDITIKENCEKCPTLWSFLKNLPGLKVALLSKLGPGTKLNTHRGWGRHSNHVIRCHFGFEVPYGCYVSVKDNDDSDEEIKLHREKDWILFDDSRHHYAHNPTKKDRIVLIVDIKRPDHIKPGDSEIGDTKELLQILDYFRKHNVDK
jgi:aspartyl/asparaginyl beta-hydroxylase (cupin superfamily)